jgi:hypothetical protein
MFHIFYEKGTGHRVKRFGDIYLEQHAGLVSGREESGGRLHKAEIIMDHTTFDECAMAWVDELAKPGRQPVH